MENTILFSETQRFRQWYVLAFILVFNAAFGLGVAQSFGYFDNWRTENGSSTTISIDKNGGVVRTEPMSDTMVIALAIGIFLLSIVILATSLKVEIKKEGVYVLYFPYFFSPTYYAWKDINKAYIRTYVKDKSNKGFYETEEGTVMRVSGNIGLQLELTDGRKLLIGTQQPENMENALRKLGILTHS